MIRIRLTMIILFGALTISCQSFFTPSDPLNKKRVYVAAGSTAVVSSSFAIGLYNTWYKKYPRQGFHLFNDWDEWAFMDKAGHLHTAYFQSLLCYKGAKWTGINKKNSIITGVICGMLFQSTIEVFDGFSSKWGFSITDMVANLSGSATFAFQQHYWNDQRIRIKISSIPINYSKAPILSDDYKAVSSLSNRAASLFGRTYFESFLKDYNAQTYWASVNIHSFFPEGNNWPKWLNLAFGYGAQNLYGGYKNSWAEGSNTFSLNSADYPRYNQFFLSFDLDFNKLNTKNPFLKTLFSGLNIFKIPSPTIEINTEGRIVFHLFK